MTLIPVLLANAVKNTNGNTINGAFTTGRMEIGVLDRKHCLSQKR